MKWRVVFGLGLVIAVFAASLLGSAPGLHERLHGTAPQHQCAATLVAGGNYDDSAPLPVLAALSPPAVSGLPLEAPNHVAASFLSSSILEHAPPAHA